MMSVMASCEKFGSDVEAPSVQVTVSPENPKVGDEVTITISTDAQYLSHRLSPDLNHLVPFRNVLHLFKAMLFRLHQNCFLQFCTDLAVRSVSRHFPN